MNLDTLIEDLVRLQQKGHGSKKVYSYESSSGAMGKISHAAVDEYIDQDFGPFDLEKRENYIKISTVY